MPMARPPSIGFIGLGPFGRYFAARRIMAIQRVSYIAMTVVVETPSLAASVCWAAGRSGLSAVSAPQTGDWVPDPAGVKE
jgi:hypothetical protein